MRIKHVDALRGLAAFTVVLLHLAYSSNIVAGLKPRFLFHLLKVEAFYVITGFALLYGLHHYAYRLRLFPAYMAKRFLRLEPAYLLALAVAYAVAMLAGEARPSLPQLLLHVGYLNDFFDEKWFVPPFWTLAVEFQFYLFAGLAYKAFVVKSNAWFGAFAAVLLATMVLCCQYLPHLSFLPRNFGFFLLGVFTFRFKVFKTSLPVYLFFTAVTLALITAVYDWHYAFTALLTVLGILFFRVPEKGFFGTRLHWLGKVSYSLYLIHWPIGFTLVLAAKRIPLLAAHASVPVTFATFASLGSAWLLHRYVEQPSAQLSRRLMHKKPEQPSPTTVQPLAPSIHVVVLKRLSIGAKRLRQHVRQE